MSESEAKNGAEDKAKIAALYARVSTDNQDLNRQEDKLIDWATSHGYDYTLFSEKVSSIRERPQFETIMENVEEYDVIAVTKIDRFGRSIQDILEKVQLIKDEGAEFVAIDQPINTDDELLGDLTLKMMALFAEFERKMIRKRLEEGYREALAQDRVGRPSKLDEAEGDEIERMYEKGASYKFLANHYDVSVSTIYRVLKSRGAVGSDGG